MRRYLIAGLTAGSLVLGTALPAAAAPSPPGPDVISAILPSDPLTPSPQPVPLTRAIRNLNVTYQYQGNTYTLDQYINDRTRAWGMVVLDGRSNTIVRDHYFASSRATRFQSWSASKSFVGTAVGIALAEGHIASIDDPVTTYLPELNGSGFAGVSIRNLLRMSSGVQWTEELDIPQAHLGAAAGNPLTEFAKSRVRGWEPGTQQVYSGMNTFVLTWLLTKTTGTPFAQYVQQKIWNPAGMASAATVSRDYQGSSLGYCCMMATVEDFSRLGLLYLNNGASPAGQVVPASWVQQATSPSAPFNEPAGELGVGYGLHWWLGGGTHGDYWADGFGGQKIYVNPEHGVVIAKTALMSTSSATEDLIAFRAIAARVAATRP
ncbi:serine hydrolase domain-containing protein [Actinomadura flavalba]|uniref:serine hydrolase domain-containing protein n=1 Tax=Actinomadura flavalba TaxID=1120938 RepID=UPI00037476DA|nr:serine hydrolase domain-containing protein [Actinomadura flavalba]